MSYLCCILPHTRYSMYIVSIMGINNVHNCNINCKVFKRTIISMLLIAECLSMRHIILRGEGCLLSSMRYVYIFIYLFIYLFIHLFIGLSRSTVQSMIVYRVNLFPMPGIQCVVYAKLSQVLTATSCCLLLIAMNRIKLSMRQLLISLKRFSILQCSN